MIAALLIISVACAVFWLVFFRFKLIRLTPGWGFIFGVFVVHLMLVFLIGLRFVTPYSTNATVVQRTIQVVPRLPEPTLVTDVLVEEGAPVKKGQPLFQFDRRPYEYKVDQIQAQLAEAKQNVRVLKLDVDVAAQDATRTKVELAYQQYQKKVFDELAKEQAVREVDIEQWLTRVNAAQATTDGATAALERAQTKYRSEINGVNTTVANMEAQLKQALYYLDNTTLTAPEDGHIINLQVRPGMVSGIYRIGGIAALIADADRYVLATYFQENLKYVRRAIRFNDHLTGDGPTVFAHVAAWGWRASCQSRRMRPIAVDRRRCGSSRRTRRARRCAGSARRSGASLGAPRPSWFCPNGKPDEGEYSQAENDNRNRPHFDNGKPSCHAPIFSAVERQR